MECALSGSEDPQFLAYAARLSASLFAGALVASAVCFSYFLVPARSFQAETLAFLHFPRESRRHATEVHSELDARSAQ